MENTINVKALLKSSLDDMNFDKIMALQNDRLHTFVANAIMLCHPESVFICTDNQEDLLYICNLAIDRGEETPLAIEGHTVHFDGYYDQARDKEHTKYLVPEGMDLGANINAVDKQTGEAEIFGILRNSMKGKQMIVRFLSLGPTNSCFSISCCQITDSAYVAHSESLLYRRQNEES